MVYLSLSWNSTTLGAITFSAILPMINNAHLKRDPTPFELSSWIEKSHSLSGIQTLKRFHLRNFFFCGIFCQDISVWEYLSSNLPSPTHHLLSCLLLTSFFIFSTTRSACYNGAVLPTYWIYVWVLIVQCLRNIHHHEGFEDLFFIWERNDH